MNHCVRKFVLAVFCIGSAGSALAGGVTVNFVHPEQFSDVPTKVAERERTLGEISAHFQKLGATLPASQELAIDVLDVDLAGTPTPDGNGEERRLLRDNYDWAHMHLRYTLSENGKVIRSGDMNISDVGAPHMLLSVRPSSSLPREARMIDRWWRDTIEPVAVAQR